MVLADGGAPPLSLKLRIPFSILHFFEFAIWGAWFVVLGNYLNSLNFSRRWIGTIYATIPIGAIIAPIFGGTIADRYFNAEDLMGVLHLVGACFLIWMAYARRPGVFFLAALLYALAYSPTLALANSVVFAHIPDASRDFPLIRVLGTIGWIAAGLSLKLFIHKGQPMNNRPILLAACLSLVLGVFSFFLPNTPPPDAPSAAAAQEETPADPSAEMPKADDAAPLEGDGWADAIPFLAGFQMLQNTDFAIFIGVSFLITIALSFYYSFTALYLEQHAGVETENVGPLMTIGQWVEIIFMFTLPWFLTTLGMKWVLATGMLAWGIRYGLFAIGRPFAIVILGIGLHGICFDFFFAAGMIHTENVADPAIRSSAQSLFAVVTYGLGMWIGTEASGWLNQRLTTEQPAKEGETPVKVTNWSLFWAIPSIAVFVCLVLFLVLFRN